MSAVSFTFDEDFDNNSGSSLSRNKLEDIRTNAYEEGLNNGRTEILTGLEQSCDVLLQNILAATQNLSARQTEQMSLMNKEAAKLAYAIIEKLAPAAVAQTPLEEIELLVNQCLKNSPLEPRLVIRVDEAIITSLHEKIEKMKQDSGYPGQIVLIGEPMAHISDCRVEWANGGAERDFNNLMSTIESTVQLFIDAPDSDHTGPKALSVEEQQSRQKDQENGTISETITGQS